MIALFCGADELALSEALAEQKARIPADFADLNITVLDGRRLKASSLAAACEAMPFLSETRLVLVEGALKHLKAGAERDAVRDYLPRVPETTDLIFVEAAEVDRRSSLFGFFKQARVIREFQPREGAELQRWLQQRARMLDAKLQPEGGTLLVEFIGNESRALANELAKLAAYVGPGGTIGSAEVRLLVPDSSESSVFEFVDALAARRLAPALQLLHSLFADGAAATYLLFMVGRQVRILLGVSELAAARMQPEAIAAELGQKPFVVRKALSQAGRFEREALLRLHDRLVELDHWSKTGRIEPEAALELLVGETCDQQTSLNTTTPRADVRMGYVSRR
jgi:DNA polymerase-3 subunit delta